MASWSVRRSGLAAKLFTTLVYLLIYLYDILELKQGCHIRTRNLRMDTSLPQVGQWLLMP